jgi:phosphatidylglycerol---prolipoprotein diacylglyceryl transferase
MRPVLISIPSKLLFFAAIALAIGTLVWDTVQRRRDPKRAKSSTPLYALAGAWLLLGLRGGTWIPSGAAFRHPWEPVPIYAYGVMLGTSMVVGWFLALRLAKQDGITQESAGAIYMWTAVWSIVGARVLYILTNYAEFDGPLDALKVWKGGLVAYGGMIGGFLASWYNCRKRNIPLLRWADVSAPSVVLGTAITRIGCLLFGCDYGKPTELAWGIRFPKGSPAWNDHAGIGKIARDAAQSLPVHPTQMYETLVGLALFTAMMLTRRWRRFSGQVFLVWVIGYGILRPVVELFRDDKQRGNVGPLSTSQFIGLVSVLLGVAFLVHLVRRYRSDPQGMRLWEVPLEPVPAAGRARAGKRRGGR